MKTDSLFYKLFQIAPWLLFEMLDRPTSLMKNYRFESVEVKQTSKRIDGVFMPHQWGTHPIYFVEVQFQIDQDFYYRLFTEIFDYLGQKKVTTDWRAAVIFANHRVEPEVPIPYRWLMLPHVQRIYLDDLASLETDSVSLEMVRLIVAKKREAINQGKQLLEKINLAQDQANEPEMVELLEAVLLYKLPDLSAEELRKMLVVDSVKKIRVYQEGRAEGRVEGWAEGRVEGRSELQIEAVPRLLKLGLSPQQIAESLGLDVKTVRKIAKMSQS